MSSKLHFIEQEYNVDASVSIKAIVNAVGKQSNYTVQRANGTIEYINEKNAFGDNCKLNKNAIILYIYLHYLNPNQNAHVLLDIAEACDFLKMSERTVLNNLRILQRSGYIMYVSGILEGTYDIFIEFYTENGNTASQSGRGFVTIPLTLFNEIKVLNGLNKVRLALRSVINAFPGKQNSGLETGCSFSSLRRLFPVSTKKKDIINILEDTSLNKILKVEVSKALNYCKVKVKDTMHPASAASSKHKIAESALKNIRNLFKSLDIKHEQNQMRPTEKELRDISKITYRIPLQKVETAIRKVYYSYERSAIKNLPALIRSLSTE